MQREECIKRLQANKAAIKARGVSHLHLYGSHARDSAGPASDVDLFFDRDPNAKLGLFELARLQFQLEDILGTKVDIATRTSLHPSLKERIIESAVQVF
jgi:uncharacterized protein